MASKDKSFVVPKTVRNNAKRGLEMREKYGRGGLDTRQAAKEGVGSGVARARDLIEGRVTYETVKRMLAFFRRHEQHKDSRTENGEPGAGMVAWALWGGDAGYRWARSIVREEEGIKKGSLTEILELGPEPDFIPEEEEEYDWDEDDTLDAPEEQSIKKGMFADLLAEFKTEYKPFEFTRNAVKEEPVIPPQPVAPEPVVEAPSFSSFSDIVNRMINKVEIVEEALTPEPQEEAPESPVLAEEAPPEVEASVEPVEANTEELKASEPVEPTQEVEAVSSLDSLLADNGREAPPQEEAPVQETVSLDQILEANGKAPTTTEEVVDSPVEANTSEEASSVEAPVADTTEAASNESTEPLDLGSATPEQQEKSLSYHPSLKGVDQDFDPLVKSQSESFFVNWCKSLETQGKKVSGNVLNLLDRNGWEALSLTVKNASKYCKSPVAKSKSKKVNRMLKKGFIDLSLIPYAVKTIETREDSVDYHLCGGQELLDVFGNYCYEAVSKAKARVDTDKDGTSHPAKYFEGLDQETRKKREKVIEERMKEGVKPPKLYEDLPGDDEADTKRSKYSKTKIAEEIREEIKKPGKKEFIRAASKVSGVKPSIIEQVYDRGMKAWSTSGHRPGAGPEQWAIARVYSFLSGGKTQKTADKDLWEEHQSNN